jgi:hypothetical protein
MIPHMGTGLSTHKTYDIFNVPTQPDKEIHAYKEAEWSKVGLLTRAVARILGRVTDQEIGGVKYVVVSTLYDKAAPNREGSHVGSKEIREAVLSVKRTSYPVSLKEWSKNLDLSFAEPDFLNKIYALEKVDKSRYEELSKMDKTKITPENKEIARNVLTKIMDKDISQTEEISIGRLLPNLSELIGQEEAERAHKNLQFLKDLAIIAGIKISEAEPHH